MIVPVVLAAGASSRMGRCKALLPFHDGRCALELIIDACAQAGLATPVVVVGPPEFDAVRIRIAGHPIELRVNPARERGQLSSLQVGLAALPRTTEAFLIWPVDCPLVPGAEVRRMADVFRVRGQVDTVVAFSYRGRRGHPILLAASLLPALLALDSTEATRSARDVIAANLQTTFYITTKSRTVVFDLDTPEDYRRAHRWLRAAARKG